MARQRDLLVILVVLNSSCDSAVGDAIVRLPGDSVAAPTGTAWGEYLDGLDVGPCPNAANGELMVDTVAWQLDAPTTLTSRAEAGAQLSLAEALWLAVNRPGQDTIRFDPNVFAGSPATLITIDCSVAEPPTSLAETCLDGRGAAVAVSWAMPVCDMSQSWDLGTASLQVGLMILNPPMEQSVWAGSQVAGCRYGTDGLTAYAAPRWQVDAGPGAIIGPGNIFASPEDPLRTLGNGVQDNPALISANYFGWDPVSEARFPSNDVLDLRWMTTLSGNVFAVDGVIAYGDLFNAIVRFEGNYFGVTPAGAPIPGTNHGLDLQGGYVVIGPGNQFVALASPAVRITVGSGAPDSYATITRNTMTGNSDGIVFVGVPPVAAPSVNGYAGGVVSGSCATPGTLELFLAADAQGAEYLGSTACDTSGAWQLSEITVSLGRSLTATLTDAAGQTSPFATPFAVL